MIKTPKRHCGAVSSNYMPNFINVSGIFWLYGLTTKVGQPPTRWTFPNVITIFNGKILLRVKRKTNIHIWYSIKGVLFNFVREIFIYIVQCKYNIDDFAEWFYICKKYIEGKNNKVLVINCHFSMELQFLLFLHIICFDLNWFAQN